MKAYEKILNEQTKIELLDKDLITPIVSSMTDGIIKAHKEACLRGIEANAVVISDGLFFSQLTLGGVDIPMICGLKAFYSADELPDDVLFAVVQAQHVPLTKDEKIQELKKENAYLKNKLQDILGLITEIDEE